MLEPDPLSPKGEAPGSVRYDKKSNGNDGLVKLLESKIELVEHELSKAQISYSDLQTEYRELHDKYAQSSDKYKKAALIMTEYLDELLADAPNDILGQALHLNVEELRRTPLDQLSKKDKVALALVLLKQLQPYLSATTLSTQDNSSAGPSRRRLHAAVRQSMTPEGKELPSSSNEMRVLADRTESDVGALQSMLKNVSVSQRMHSGPGTEENSGSAVMFPPI